MSIESIKSVKQVIHEYAESIYKAKKDGPGWLTPYPELNKALMPGIPKNTITAVAAFSGVGKTAFMLNLAFNAPILNKDMEVLIYTLEMPGKSLIARRASTITGKQVKQLYNEEVDLTIFGDISELPIYFIEETGKPERIYNDVIQFITSRPDKDILVIIDHSLLIEFSTNKDTNNEKIEAISEVFNRLKQKYPRFNGMIVSQLNDSMMDKNRISKKGQQMFPIYTDLMNGRKLWQICDTVIILNRPKDYIEESVSETNRYAEYNGYSMVYPKMPDGNKIIYAHIAKGRDTGTGLLAYIDKLYRNEFEEIDIDKLKKR